MKILKIMCARLSSKLNKMIQLTWANTLVCPYITYILFTLLFIITSTIYNVVNAEGWPHWLEITHEEVFHRGPDANARAKLLDYVSDAPYVRVKIYPVFSDHTPQSILPWPTYPYTILPEFFPLTFRVPLESESVPVPSDNFVELLQCVPVETQIYNVCGQLFDQVNNCTNTGHNLKNIVTEVIHKNPSTQLWYQPNMKEYDDIHQFSVSMFNIIKSAIQDDTLSEKQKEIFTHINTQIFLKTYAEMHHKEFNLLLSNNALYEDLFKKAIKAHVPK